LPKHKTNRADILATTQRLFVELGYANTTMKDIADECGVYKGSIYHIFPSKLAILEAVFEDYIKSAEREIFSVAWNVTLPLTNRIDTYFDKYRTNIVRQGQIPLYIELVLESRLSVEVGNLSDIFIRDFLKSLQTLIKDDEHGKRLLHLIIGFHISAISGINTLDLTDIRLLTHTFAKRD
jgi:AcrR family transcriptional regulator